MNRYVLGVAAELDLNAIWDYIAQDNMDATDRWISKLFDAFEALALSPGMGHRREDLSAFPILFWPVGAYPRQNGLAVALRELGRIERTQFILSWLQSVELRRRVHAGLNKGEARNALARAVFLCRLGEIRDRSFEQQRYRASGLTLVTAAIALWNTVYIERAVQTLTSNGQALDPELLKYLSPLGWEHINLTGDYQ